MSDNSNTPRPARQTSFQDGYFRVQDGLNLHYRDYAGRDSVPPILCLHGLTRNARDFAQFAERYSPRFRVLALDFRGRSLSENDPDPSRYRPLTYAGDVIALLDHLNIDRAIFVGTSLGGLVTMVVAGLAPGRIAAAVLNDVGPQLAREGLGRIRNYVGNDVRFADWDDAARHIAANSNGLPARYTDDDWARMARRTCREEDGAVRFDYDMAIAQPIASSDPAPEVDLWPLFRALANVPLLVVRGGQSDLLRASGLQAMAEARDDLVHVTAPGVGHAPDLDEPEVVPVLDSFLEQLAGDAAT